MLSYRHAYHAGNHADVLKHLVLVSTLHYATRKASPLFYLDTHGGAALYFLQSEQALKTGEAANGIRKIDFAALGAGLDEETRNGLDLYAAALKPYLDKKTYPGSPLLAANLLRRNDHLHLCELHTVEYQLLRHHTDGDPRIACEHIDGYQRALALLPPVQKRAVVLIDPSYETNDEFRRTVRLVVDINQRMRSAHILLWYPVVGRGDVDRMIAALQRSEVRDLWQFELGVAPDQIGHGLTASGMLVVNPPYTLPGQLRALLPRIQEQLAPAYGHWVVKNLIAE